MSVAAIILAAGFGTRLAPLTDTTPKPLLVVGEQPVISHLVRRLSALDDLTKIVVVANAQHLAQWDVWAGTQPDVIVVSNGVRTDHNRVGAVADLALGLGELGTHDRVVVLAGDNLLDESLQPHLDASRLSGHPVVLCRDLGDHVPPGRFGEITVDDDHRIVRFREKPAEPESPLAATCSYVLTPDACDSVADYLTKGDADSPGSFVAWLATRQPVLARPLQGRYFDIGNHETLAAARSAYDERS